MQYCRGTTKNDKNVHFNFNSGFNINCGSSRALFVTSENSRVTRIRFKQGVENSFHNST